MKASSQCSGFVIRLLGVIFLLFLVDQSSLPQWVRTFNGAGLSAYSNTASATTQLESMIFLPVVLGNQPSGANLCNGDFEQGTTCWTEYSTHGWPLIVNKNFPSGVAPLSGSWAVWLGGDVDETSSIQQQATIPADRYYLAYYHWILSEDSCGHDFGRVVVNGSVIVDVYDLCSSQDTGGWVKHVVNLSAYTGQSISLEIQAVTDLYYNSNLFVDDVAFQSGSSALESSLGVHNPAMALPRGALKTGR